MKKIITLVLGTLFAVLLLNVTGYSDSHYGYGSYNHVQSYYTEFQNNREVGGNIYRPAKDYRDGGSHPSYKVRSGYPENYGSYNHVQSYYTEFQNNREVGGNIYAPAR